MNVNNLSSSVESFSDEKQIIEMNRIWNLFWAKRLWILCISLLFAIVAGVFTKLCITPTYKSSIKLYVYASMDRTENYTVSNNDLNAAQGLADIYSIILKSDTVTDAVAKKINNTLNEEYFTRSIISKITDVETINDTSVMQIIVRYKDPVLAASIANAFAEVAPDEIVRITKAGGVEIVDYAQVSGNPVAPNVGMNITVAFFVGFLLCCVVLAVRAQMNQVLITESDISRITEISVLATIPVIISSNGKNSQQWTFKE